MLGVCLCALVLQTIVGPVLVFRNGELSLVAFCLIIAAIDFDVKTISIVALLLGLSEDIVSATGFAWTVASLGMVLCIAGCARWILADEVFLCALLIASGVLVRAVIFWSVTALCGYPHVWVASQVHAALWSAAGTAVIGALLLRPLRRFYGKAGI